jgi:hypothetical protein
VTGGWSEWVCESDAAELYLDVEEVPGDRAGGGHRLRAGPGPIEAARKKSLKQKDKLLSGRMGNGGKPESCASSRAFEVACISFAHLIRRRLRFA